MRQAAMVQKLNSRRRAIRKIAIFVLVSIGANKIGKNGQPVQNR
jgi:hypothetical protein